MGGAVGAAKAGLRIRTAALSQLLQDVGRKEHATVTHQGSLLLEPPAQLRRLWNGQDGLRRLWNGQDGLRQSLRWLGLLKFPCRAPPGLLKFPCHVTQH